MKMCGKKKMGCRCKSFTDFEKLQFTLYTSKDLEGFEAINQRLSIRASGLKFLFVVGIGSAPTLVVKLQI